LARLLEDPRGRYLLFHPSQLNLHLSWECRSVANDSSGLLTPSVVPKPYTFFDCPPLTSRFFPRVNPFEALLHLSLLEGCPFFPSTSESSFPHHRVNYPTLISHVLDGNLIWAILFLPHDLTTPGHCVADLSGNGRRRPGFVEAWRD